MILILQNIQLYFIITKLQEEVEEDQALYTYRSLGVAGEKRETPLLTAV